MTGTHPHAGARFELDLLDAPASRDGAARYRARIYLPEARHDYLMILQGETCILTAAAREPAEAGDPAAWATEHLQALGRLLQRGAARDGAWQRRLFRWREQRS